MTDKWLESREANSMMWCTESSSFTQRHSQVEDLAAFQFTCILPSPKIILTLWRRNYYFFF